MDLYGFGDHPCAQMMATSIDLWLGHTGYMMNYVQLSQSLAMLQDQIAIGRDILEGDLTLYLTMVGMCCGIPDKVFRGHQKGI